MIHKYTLNDYRIVMDTNSGAVHLFDEIPYIMLIILQLYYVVNAFFLLF